MRNEKQTKGTKISIWISCIVADKAKGYTSVCVGVDSHLDYGDNAESFGSWLLLGLKLLAS